MVDEVVTAAPAAPVVEAPASVVTPVVTETPVVTPVVTETPVVTPPVVEAPAPAVVAPAEIDKTQTVLGEAPKVEPVTETPVAEITVTEAPKDEKAQSEEPAPAPVFDPFALPDNVTLDAERVKEFTNILSDLEVKSKAEHALVQEFGQKAVDFHIKEVQKAQEQLSENYIKQWNTQKVQWKDDFLADPDIGGNRFQTTLDAANNFIRTHGGTAEQQKELRALLDSSGLGNHKVVIRTFAAAGRAMSEGRPLNAPAPLSPPKTKVETMYGSRK